MDNLQEIICLLSKDEGREFRQFINRQKAKKNRKDLELFDILLNDKSLKTSFIVQKLYKKDGSKEKQAYHALRKRLLDHLKEFIVVKQMDQDTSIDSKLMGQISLVRYLFDKNNGRLAWKYLRKAEKLATETDQFLLLNGIYTLQLQYSDLDDADELDQIISKSKKNKEHVVREEGSLILLAKIKQKIKAQKIEGQDQNLNKVINQLISKSEIDQDILLNPKLFNTVLLVLRSAYLGRNSMPVIADFGIQHYSLINESGKFNKHNHHIKLDILYIICHALYRDLNFEKCEKYLEEFAENISGFGKNRRNKFYPRYIMLKAGICFFSNKLDEGIVYLEGILVANDINLSKRIELNIRLTLSYYYLMAKNYDEVIRVFREVHHTDSYLESKMGKEWLMKKLLIEVGSYYGDGLEEIALSRMKSVMKKYSKLLDSTPTFNRAKVFFAFVRKFMENPSWLTPKEFKTNILPSLKIKSGQRDDPQSIVFFCWLKSKVLNADFYQTVVSTIKRLEENSDYFDFE